MQMWRNQKTMADERPNREEEIFNRALEFAPGEEREAYLDEACSSEAGLRRTVAALLEADGEPASVLETLAGRSVGSGTARGEQPGERFGRYELIEKIGDGGMGAVWRAHQEGPLGLEVALKIIKLGMDTEEVIARFEAERRALAMMDHPGIAKVFDAGATESGRPFFVMEPVDGQPLTGYCDARRLDTEARLRLFVEVCRAVQHLSLIHI